MYVVISRVGGENGAAREREDALAALCAAHGVDVLLTPHLYHVPEDSPIWSRLAGIEGPLLVASWLHARPVEWLLRRHGVESLTTLYLGAFGSAAACFAAIAEALGVPGQAVQTPAHPEELSEAAGPRWYPVVDAARCTDCGHCRQFCLWGVYETDAEGHTVVVNPDRCKAGCPACSRICPKGAIIFPLYEKDDAIAGAPGRFMEPDAAARRMYYARTGARCPQCQGEGPLAVGGFSRLKPATTNAATTNAVAAACPECGRPLPAPTGEAASGPRPAAPRSEVHDEIDALIADLDDLADWRL